MKKLLFIFTTIICALQASAQVNPPSTYALSADSIIIQRKDKQPAELVLRNATKNCTGCALVNIGNGKTEFQAIDGVGGLEIDTTVTLTGNLLDIVIPHTMGHLPSQIASFDVDDPEGASDLSPTYDATKVEIHWTVAPICVCTFHILLKP